MSHFIDAACKLHRHITSTHWTDEGLIGPDPGIRFNYRIGRFVKGYLPFLKWHEGLYYVQAQAYWILGNWTFFELTKEEQYRKIALQCSDYLLQHQRDDGAWEYPNPEWKGRLATTEATWGCIGLLANYRRSGNELQLNGVLRWYQFLLERIRFLQVGDTLAANYFADADPNSARVPNVSITLLRCLAELSDVTGDASYMEHCNGLLRFLEEAQCESGEFPYSVPGANQTAARLHFQCYQYNSFECLNLLRYFELTKDGTVLPLIKQLLKFLEGGLDESGYSYYQCGNTHRSVTYHTAVMAATFLRAHQFGFDGYDAKAERAYKHLLTRQNSNGSFPHSRGDYRLLEDRCSYPRYQSMILYHLLLPGTLPKKERASEISTVMESN